MKEHDIHNALFALDDTQEQVDSLKKILERTGKTLRTLQDYLEGLL